MKLDKTERWLLSLAVLALAMLIGVFIGGKACKVGHPLPTAPPIALVVGCEAHERLIGQIVTEHHFNKLALDDALERLNACTLDLAVERGELPPLPGKGN